MIKMKEKSMGNINLDTVCSVMLHDIEDNFGKNILSPRVKHCINDGILSIKIHFKRRDLDEAMLNTMLEYVTADVKVRKLIPYGFRVKAYHVKETKFTTDIRIDMKQAVKQR